MIQPLWITCLVWGSARASGSDAPGPTPAAPFTVWTQHVLSTLWFSASSPNQMELLMPASQNWEYGDQGLGTQKALKKCELPSQQTLLCSVEDHCALSMQQYVVVEQLNRHSVAGTKHVPGLRKLLFLGTEPPIFIWKCERGKVEMKTNAKNRHLMVIRSSPSLHTSLLLRDTGENACEWYLSNGCGLVTAN